MSTAELRRELLAHTVTKKSTGCMVWQGCRRNGYACIRRQYVTRYVHRIIADAPPGSVVRHTCDNRPCVNPEHLLVGTHAENMSDAVARNRSTQGERHPKAKLTDAIIAEIRSTYRRGYITLRDVGRKYGIGKAHVCDIVNRRIWRHVGAQS